MNCPCASNWLTSENQENKQFTFWSVAARSLLRNSLFTVSEVREALPKRMLIASTADIDLRFMGVRFNQSDLDVWEMILHFARLQSLGHKVQFSAHSFLKALGRNIDTEQFEQLKEETARLLGGTIEITWKNEKKTFIGGLIEKIYRDDETQEYILILNEKFVHLFNSSHALSYPD